MKKYFIFSIILIIITAITLNTIISENAIDAFRSIASNINIWYILLLVIMVLMYFVLHGLYIKIVLKSLDTDISLFKGMFYAMVDFFFSGITPSSTGGQPLQFYYMAKDKISSTKITITMLLNTTFFKIILVLMGFGVLLFNNYYVFGKATIYTVFFFIGLIGDCIGILACLLLLFNTGLASKVINVLYKFLCKFKFIKHYLKKVNINKVIDNYSSQASYIKEHPRRVIITFIITFIQRLILFSIAYFVYRGLGYNNMSYLEMLAIQVSVQMSIELLPIPGGAVMSENMLKDSFATLFGATIAEIGMLFTRSFVFYLPLILCFIVIIVVTISENKKYVK